jgi:hypothetical protein
MENTELEQMYLKSLSEKEYKGYLIAKSHLGSSFDLKKSIGYITWKKDNANNEKIIETTP